MVDRQLRDWHLDLWLLERLVPGITNIAASFDVAGPVEILRLRSAIERICDEEDCLKLGVQEETGRASWKSESCASDALEVRDANDDDTPEEIAERVRNEPFDLTRAPLMRVVVTPRSSGAVISVVCSRIVADEYSLRLLCENLSENYNYPERNRVPHRASYTTRLVSWPTGDDFDQELAKPCLHTHWLDSTSDGGRADGVFRITAEDAEALRQFASRDRVTLNVLATGLLCAYLLDRNGVSVASINTVISDRPPALGRALGSFTRQVQIVAESGQTFRQLVQSVQTQVRVRSAYSPGPRHHWTAEASSAMRHAATPLRLVLYRPISSGGRGLALNGARAQRLEPPPPGPRRGRLASVEFCLEDNRDEGLSWRLRGNIDESVAADELRRFHEQAMLFLRDEVELQPRDRDVLGAPMDVSRVQDVLTSHPAVATAGVSHTDGMWLAELTLRAGLRACELRAHFGQSRLDSPLPLLALSKESAAWTPCEGWLEYGERGSAAQHALSRTFPGVDWDVHVPLLHAHNFRGELIVHLCQQLRQCGFEVGPAELATGMSLSEILK